MATSVTATHAIVETKVPSEDGTTTVAKWVVDDPRMPTDAEIAAGKQPVSLPVHHVSGSVVVRAGDVLTGEMAAKYAAAVADAGEQPAPDGGDGDGS